MEPLTDSTGPVAPPPVAPFKRRAARIGFELPVRCKHGLTRATIMLKDMTRFGARVEGITQTAVGEAIMLLLPECAARMAFVVWQQGGTSGLEFGDPLSSEAFDRLIQDYAIARDVTPGSVSPAQAA